MPLQAADREVESTPMVSPWLWRGGTAVVEAVVEGMTDCTTNGGLSAKVVLPRASETIAASTISLVSWPDYLYVDDICCF
jgi:hypothetical protein